MEPSAPHQGVLLQRAAATERRGEASRSDYFTRSATPQGTLNSRRLLWTWKLAEGPFVCSQPRPQRNRRSLAGPGHPTGRCSSTPTSSHSPERDTRVATQHSRYRRRKEAGADQAHPGRPLQRDGLEGAGGRDGTLVGNSAGVTPSGFPPFFCFGSSRRSGDPGEAIPRRPLGLVPISYLTFRAHQRPSGSTILSRFLRSRLPKRH